MAYEKELDELVDELTVNKSKWGDLVVRAYSYKGGPLKFAVERPARYGKLGRLTAEEAVKAAEGLMKLANKHQQRRRPK